MLYTQKSMQISTFVPLLLRIVFTSLAGERKNEAQWCVLKMKQNLYQTRGILFFKKKKKKLPTPSLFPPNIIRVHTQLRILQRNTSNFVICYVNKNSKFGFSISHFVSVYFIFSSLINTLVFYVDIDWDIH